MPVIVIGADSAVGAAVIRAVARPDREVRAFVSNPERAEELRRTGIKVALGDLSDGSHVEIASLGCFAAILIPGAADDGRELAFAADPAEVPRTWAQAISNAAVQRAIWIGRAEESSAPESCTIDGAGLSDEEVAIRAAELDDAAVL